MELVSVFAFEEPKLVSHFRVGPYIDYMDHCKMMMHIYEEIFFNHTLWHLVLKLFSQIYFIMNP